MDILIAAGVPMLFRGLKMVRSGLWGDKILLSLNIINDQFLGNKNIIKDLTCRDCPLCCRLCRCSSSPSQSG